MALTTWNTAVAAAKAGTGQAKILFVGDSLTSGENASVRANRWVDQLIGTLRTRNSITGSGLGLTPYKYFNSLSSSWASPATSTGTVVTEDDKSYYFTQGLQGGLISSGGSLSWTVVGDSVDVLYCQAVTGYGFGSMVVSVDGTTKATINTTANNTITPGTVLHYSLGTAGTHTVKVTASGGQILVDGVIGYNGDYTAGITYWDSAHWGILPEVYDNTNDTAAWEDAWPRYNPSLVIDNLFVNDLLEATITPTASAALLTKRLAQYAAIPAKPDVIVWIPYGGGSGYNVTNGSYAYSDYCTAIVNAANTAGVNVLDLRTLYPTVSTSWYSGDTQQIHPNDTGQAAIATALANVIAPAASSTTGTATIITPRPTVTATGAQTNAASSSARPAAASASAIATITVTGTSAVHLSAPGTSASASQTNSGSGSAVPASPNASQSGTILVTGTATVTLPSASASASGQSDNTASASIQIPAPSASGYGTNASTITGTVDVNLAAPSASGSGTQTVSGTVTITPDAATVSADGQITVTGVASILLPAQAVTASATQNGPVLGAAQVMLPEALVAALGTQTVTGSAQVSLPMPAVFAADFIAEAWPELLVITVLTTLIPLTAD